MRAFQRVDALNTVAEWVDAFNNNALAANDHTWYLGEMLYNGLLYTGLETIGNRLIHSLTNLNVSSISPRVLEFDNMYLYFRNINKILLVDQVTFDLLSKPELIRNHPMFFYIDSELGFRVSQEFRQNDNEIMLFRFIINDQDKFTQLYVTSQRFGSNVYDTADEFYLVQGCEPKPARTDIEGETMSVSLGNGSIKRSGIKFDYHNMPDVLRLLDNTTPYPIRYIDPDNTIDYRKSTVTEVDVTRLLNYETRTLSQATPGKVTAQRILFDVYTGCLIMQYGNREFDTIQQAMSQVENLGYPFPYNQLMYIPLGILFAKSNADNLKDTEQALFVQHLNTTVNAGDSSFFAEDSYARGRLAALDNAVSALQRQISELEGEFDHHVDYINNPNPHHIDYLTIFPDMDANLYNLLNQSKNNFLNNLDGRYIRKDVDDITTHGLTVKGELNATRSYIKVNGKKVLVGTQSMKSGEPALANGDYGLF